MTTPAGETTHHVVFAEDFCGRATSAQRTDMMRALSHGEHLAAVVRSIFALTRSADGGLALELSDVRVQELLAEAHALVEPFAAANGVSLLVDCEHATAVVRGERTALLWALMNLACRVVTATPLGGVAVLSAVMLLDTVELRVMHTGSESASTSLSPFLERMEVAGATHEVEIARDLARTMGGELLLQGTIDEGGLYTMRFGADSRPWHRGARVSASKAA
jgi:signal transduction histidine kinase